MACVRGAGLCGIECAERESARESEGGGRRQKLGFFSARSGHTKRKSTKVKAKRHHVQYVLPVPVQTVD
jgi:hypothetical protein